MPDPSQSNSFGTRTYNPQPIRRSERVEFKNRAGVDLAGILDLPVENPVATALFTHCFTCNKDLKAIVRISRALAGRGYAVLRYDLTGLGNSSGDFSQTNFSTNREDLLAATDFLTTHLAAPSFLIGHSFGAAASLSLTEHISSVQGTAAIAGPSDTAHLADLLERMDSEIAVKGIGSVTIGGRDYVVRKQMLDDFRSHDLPAALRQVTKPVLLFHSPVDETLGFEHVLRLFACLTQRTALDPEPAPASLICLPGADHLLVKNPADIEFVANTIAAWFDRIRANVNE